MTPEGAITRVAVIGGTGALGFGLAVRLRQAGVAVVIGSRAPERAVWQGSAAQQARELVPREAALVAGLHTVSAASLSDPEARLDEDVLLCGDDRVATAEVAQLIERIPALRAVDCGRLEVARAIEQLTPLMISINVRHKTHAGVRIVGLSRPDRY